MGRRGDKVHGTDLSVCYTRMTPPTHTFYITDHAHTLIIYSALLTSEWYRGVVFSECKGHPSSHESPDPLIGSSVEPALAGRSQ